LGYTVKVESIRVQQKTRIDSTPNTRGELLNVIIFKVIFGGLEGEKIRVADRSYAVEIVVLITDYSAQRLGSISLGMEAVQNTLCPTAP
jgi:hypothetical protein